MKQYQGISGLIGGVAIALVQSPVLAAPTQITNVQLRPTSQGVDVLLQTESGDRPQIFTMSSGNSQVADIINTQLRLPQNNFFRQDNPAPGIASVIVTQLDTNSVRVIVTGTTSLPNGQLSARDERGLVFNFSPGSGSTAAAPVPNVPPPPGLPSLGGGPMAQSPPPMPMPQPGTAVPIPTTMGQDVLVPNPEITIDGAPASRIPPTAPPAAISPSAAPPFLPRAIAPPLGDIAISNIDAAPSVIDLGSGERVPRLVLRDAPVRDVLALLARAAGYNLAFTAGTGTQQGQQGQQAPLGQQGQGRTGAEGPTISLDIENEPVQDVFNYILRLSGLQANRQGRTIFVGTQLPIAASNTVLRSLRLNQASATAAANFLVGQGAELQLPITRVQLVPIGTGANQTITRIEEPDIKVIKAQQGAGPLVLSGLSVVADSRLNSVTLVGDPRKVEIASALLSQLDLRRRQVAVNVKILDVNLLNTDLFNTSFAFGIGDFYFSTDGQGASAGLGPYRPPTADERNGSLFNRPVIGNPYLGVDPEYFLNNPFYYPEGNRSPENIPQASAPLGPGGSPIRPGITDQQEDTIEFGLPSLFQFPRRFLAALRAQITNGNAKILTDPTLVVQEGQTATVNLTQQVVGNVRVERESSEGVTTSTATAEIAEAGLSLSVNVPRIDDNGFVTLNVSPQVTAIGNTQTIDLGGDENTIVLLQERSLSTGEVRLRDSQTLILSGIIQENERVNVSKVPILGDLPIIGSLFRRTTRTNERAEVIVVVTPYILDDSERSFYGYGYRPGREVLPILQRQQRGLPSGDNR